VRLGLNASIWWSNTKKKYLPICVEPMPLQPSILIGRAETIQEGTIQYTK